jgi:hypothetical protein
MGRRVYAWWRQNARGQQEGHGSRVIAEIKRLQAKVGELVMHNEVRKEATLRTKASEGPSVSAGIRRTQFRQVKVDPPEAVFGSWLTLNLGSENASGSSHP